MLGIAKLLPRNIWVNSIERWNWVLFICRSTSLQTSRRNGLVC